MANFNYVIYLPIYVLAIIFLVVLGCYMLAQRGNVMGTHGEQESKLRMTRMMSVTMFVWAFDLFIYIPVILSGWSEDHVAYKVLFLLSLMMSTPVVFIDMFAVVQRRVNIRGWVCALGLPFLLLAICNLMVPESNVPANVGATLSVVSILFLLVKFYSEYRNYVERIHSEYSETSRREILWSWVCFSGLAVQAIVYVVYQLLWSPVLECIYFVLSIGNAVSLCYCTCRQVTIDIDIVEDEKIEEEDAEAVKTEKEKQRERALCATIEEKLELHCEGRLLYLDPTLTREQLCHRLNIGSTYLKMYFHSRGLSFYQYVNTLRVEYAYKLMMAHPDMSISDVCQQSGFRSQTTFRKMFVEVMGCKPSEVRNKEEKSSR